VIAALALAAALPACSWNAPGQDPYTGPVPVAVERYTDIPPEVRARLRARMERRAYDDVADITRDRVAGRHDYTDLRGMHFGTGRICATVTRDRWAPSAVERGLVYCEGEHCLIVPTVCRNVARVTRQVLRESAGDAGHAGHAGAAGAAGGPWLAGGPGIVLAKRAADALPFAAAAAPQALALAPAAAQPEIPQHRVAAVPIPAAPGPVYLVAPVRVPVVPEPPTLALAAAGAAVVLLRRKYRRGCFIKLPQATRGVMGAAWVFHFGNGISYFADSPRQAWCNARTSGRVADVPYRGPAS
jgi:PEP-CTERM motif